MVLGLGLNFRRDVGHVESPGLRATTVGRRRRRAERGRRGPRRAALLRPLVYRREGPRGGPEDLLPPRDLALVGLLLVLNRRGLAVPVDLPGHPPPAPLQGRRQPRGAAAAWPFFGEADVEQDEAAAGGRGAAPTPAVPEQDDAEEDEEQGRQGRRERDGEREADTTTTSVPHLAGYCFEASRGRRGMRCEDAMYSRPAATSIRNAWTSQVFARSFHSKTLVATAKAPGYEPICICGDQTGMGHLRSAREVYRRFVDLDI